MDGYALLKEIRGMGIQQYKTDVAFRTLVESVNENLYIIPKYQRKYRWSEKQVRDLAESLICGFPIPPIYTCRNEQNQLEILDGQQRVMSLFFYYIGYYMNKRKNSCIDFSKLVVEDKTFEEALSEQYEMEELHISLEGKQGKPINVDYKNLSPELKRQIDYTTVTVIEIKTNDEKIKLEVLRRIFKNLNKGGSLLSDQEQRNGIYGCEFYDMLQEMNRNNVLWRNLWGREDAKEQDLEALLRFCALRRYVSVRKELTGCNFQVDGYKGSYSKLFDRFSEEAMNFGISEILEYKKSLTDFLSLFRVNSKQASKVTLLESFYINYEKMHVRKPITDELCRAVLRDGRYTAYARQGTVSLKSMNERWKTVYEIWSRADI